MKASSFMTLLSSLAFAAPGFALVARDASATTEMSSIITPAPLTTLPSSSTIYVTSTPILSNVSTSTTGGSVTIVPHSATWIVPTPTGTPMVSGEYRLRTKVLDKGHAKFDNLYLAAWSLTYGYYADAGLTKNKSQAAMFYQNETYEQLDFGDGKQWSLTVNYNTLSSRWYGVSAHSPNSWSYGSFWLNGTGLEWTPNTSPPPHPPNGTLAALDSFFGGWMACDWWHGVPQLFYKVGGFDDTVLPSTCANILLLQDYPR